MSSKLGQVQNVDIDNSGRFKYILVKVIDGSNHKHVVRGYSRAEYHGRFINLRYMYVFVMFTSSPAFWYGSVDYIRE